MTPLMMATPRVPAPIAVDAAGLTAAARGAAASSAPAALLPAGAMRAYIPCASWASARTSLLITRPAVCVMERILLPSGPGLFRGV